MVEKFQFSALLSRKDLEALAQIKNQKFRFLGGVDVCNLWAICAIEISSSNSFLEITSDYILPLASNGDLGDFEVAKFEVGVSPLANAEKRMKQGWVFLQGSGQVIKEVFVARTLSKENSETLEADQAIILQLDKCVLVMKFDWSGNFLFVVEFFKTISAFEKAFLQVLERHLEGTSEISMKLHKASELVEETNV